MNAMVYPLEPKYCTEIETRKDKSIWGSPKSMEVQSLSWAFYICGDIAKGSIINM